MKRPMSPQGLQEQHRDTDSAATSPLVGEALDMLDRLSWAMEFWRRREPAHGRRGDDAGDDRGDYRAGRRAEDRGGAAGCHEDLRLGFGADIVSRVADLANTTRDGATVGGSVPGTVQPSRPLGKRHRAPPEVRVGQSADATSVAGAGLARRSRCRTHPLRQMVGRLRHPSAGSPFDRLGRRDGFLRLTGKRGLGQRPRKGG
jgi:hypothetical protein